MKQDDLFLNGEGDAYFIRNKNTVSKILDGDEIPKMLSEIKITPTKILDCGCSGGDRLNILQKQFGCDCYGIDPSLDAIVRGRQQYPHLYLSRDCIADMNFSELFFDLVTARFVFHWIDRNTLLKSCERIDDCLKWGGYLVISDFFKKGFVKRKYHHTEEGVFTYKQFYPTIFLSTGNYEHIVTKYYPYDETDTMFVTILRKQNVSVLE